MLKTRLKASSLKYLNLKCADIHQVKFPITSGTLYLHCNHLPYFREPLIETLSGISTVSLDIIKIKMSDKVHLILENIDEYHFPDEEHAVLVVKGSNLIFFSIWFDSYKSDWWYLP